MTEAQILKIVDDVIAQGPYQPNWSSLMTAPVPDWFRKRKLGIFIHWGVYSVTAKFNEWYSRNMYIKDSTEYRHHILTYGPHNQFGYKNFIPMLTAEHFDAGQWMRLFREAGPLELPQGHTMLHSSVWIQYILILPWPAIHI